MSNYCIICITISIIAIFCSDISSLSGITSVFSGNNAIIRRNNAHLTQNVVLLDNCNIPQIHHIAQYIQLFTSKIPLLSCIESVQLSMRILLIELALNVHIIYGMKNKPYVNLRGGINYASYWK